MRALAAEKKISYNKFVMFSNENQDNGISKSLRRKGLVQRWLFLCLSLAVMAFGVAFSIKANLGTSPISSVPYVGSLFTPLTVGEFTICMHVVFILLQIIILRSRYKPIQLLQLPVAVLFGYLTDFALWVLRGVDPPNYGCQWILCVIGIIVVAAGVSMEVTANVVVLAGEGVQLAVCQVAPIQFSRMKIIFDVSLVCIACVLSLTMVGGLHGVREGTVAAAILVGGLTRFMLHFEKQHIHFADNPRRPPGKIKS